MAGLHKSRSPSRHDDTILYGRASNLWILCVKLTTFNLDGPYIFKLYPRFLENFCIHGLEFAFERP